MYGGQQVPVYHDTANIIYCQLSICGYNQYSNEWSETDFQKWGWNFTLKSSCTGWVHKYIYLFHKGPPCFIPWHWDIQKGNILGVKKWEYCIIFINHNGWISYSHSLYYGYQIEKHLISSEIVEQICSTATTQGPVGYFATPGVLSWTAPKDWLIVDHGHVKAKGCSMYGLMLLFNALFQTSTIFRNSHLLKLNIEYFKSPYPGFGG